MNPKDGPWKEFREAARMSAFIAFHQKRYENGESCYMIAVTSGKAFEFLRAKGFTHCMEIDPAGVDE